LWDVETLQEMKVYSTQTELNSACITPGKPYIILGGGQDAMSVTTTGSRQGKFEALFWHKLFEEEIGRVKGHLYVPLVPSITELTIKRSHQHIGSTPTRKRIRIRS
jgi:hypothetical protein